MNTRRRFLSIAGGAALGVSFPVRAQQRQFRIGWISGVREEQGTLFLAALRDGLRELGYVEGRNLFLQVQWNGGSPGRLEQVAAELARAKLNVIVAQGASAFAMRKATATTPVVFGFSGDPVEAKLVDSFSRPGGNFTGISFLTLELAGKRIELLKEILPGLKRVAVVAQPQHPGDQAERRASQNGASAVGLALDYHEMRSAEQLEAILNAIDRARSEAVVMFPVASVMSAAPQIAKWSIKRGIPAISGWAQFADGGNLMSYGPNLRESFRRLATFVDKIVKGAKPADLPVELPTRVEFVLNLKTARALGITIPQSILLRADRVIE
ncbi:MAG: ABC transporter substrate-binding protein [Betaproteobacteria bacterium]